MSEKSVHIPAISCGHCTARIEREIGALEGVTSVKADVNSKSATITWQPPADWDGIEATLKDLGYPPQ
ncbi:MAG: heavy-metal-associated domain-containing protein [Desulfarculaceae bacterium]|nr:heavy-metal-associated domain-containing protein [Desulfarculaceae bacterium]MCF8047395.1 heavy-metal-associated domain-containing protein [Desulfarculaceae bacterium]MCF8065275.1 heavy-metal-associated domain-containing protein [Desulfarculaceae bacterium]MCF8096657.1 heavy-metal-associated domain-containing protein [Desulfarculaceae bacterium]